MLGKSWRTVAAVLFCILILAAPAVAQPVNDAQPLPEAPIAGGFDLVNSLLQPLISAVVFTLVGMVLFAISIWLIVKLAPFSVVKEIEEDQNTSLGIIIGSVIIGIAIILAAALVG